MAQGGNIFDPLDVKGSHGSSPRRLGMWLIQTGQVLADAVESASPHRINFSDPQSGLRQVSDNSAGDYTWLYGWPLIAGVGLVILLVYKLMVRFGANHMLAKLLDDLSGLFQIHLATAREA